MCYFKAVTFEAYTTEPQIKPDYYQAEETHQAYLARRRKNRATAKARNIELNAEKRIAGAPEKRSSLAAELNAAYDPHSFAMAQASYDAMEPDYDPIFEWESDGQRTAEHDAQIILAAQEDAATADHKDTALYYAGEYMRAHHKELRRVGYDWTMVHDIYFDVFHQ